MNAILGGKRPMERFRGPSLDGNRGLLDEIEGSITIPEWPGVPEWRGRFWLPKAAGSSPVAGPARSATPVGPGNGSWHHPIPARPARHVAAFEGQSGHFFDIVELNGCCR